MVFNKIINRTVAMVLSLFIVSHADYLTGRISPTINVPSFPRPRLRVKRKRQNIAAMKMMVDFSVSRSIRDKKNCSHKTCLSNMAGQICSLFFV